MSVSHISLDLCLRYQRCDRVDDNDINGTAAGQHITDFQRLLSRILLGNQELLNPDAQILRIDRVQGMLRIDEGSLPPGLLRLRNHVQRQSGLSGGFRTEYFHNPSPGNAAHPGSQIQADGSGGDRLHIHTGITQLHDRSLTELLLYLCQGRFQSLFPSVLPILRCSRHNYLHKNACSSIILLISGCLSRGA